MFVCTHYNLKSLPVGAVDPQESISGSLAFWYNMLVLFLIGSS